MLTKLPPSTKIAPIGTRLTPAPIPDVHIPINRLNIQAIEYASMPVFSLLLGVEKKGTPLIIDLVSAHWGSLLFSGPESASAALWNTLLTANNLIHYPHEISIWIFSQRPGIFYNALSNWNGEYLIATCADHAMMGIERLLISSHNYVNQDYPDRVQLVIWDQIDQWLNTLTDNAIRQMQFLWQDGAHTGIRSFASRSNFHHSRTDDQFLEPFRTRVTYINHKPVPVFPYYLDSGSRKFNFRTPVNFPNGRRGQ